MTFDYPTYNRYRTLALLVEQMQGADVYALQHAINAVIAGSLVTDGILGPKTGEAIVKAQVAVRVEPDGKAGVVTQRALALAIVSQRLNQGKHKRLTKGQLQHESSFLLGNYSARRPNGSFDAGVAQLNSEHHALDRAFNPEHSINLLIARTRDAYDRYHDRSLFVGNDHTDLRRWKLAAGSWNAPAFANYLAGTPPWAVPSDAARETFETYMNEVTVYL